MKDTKNELFVILDNMYYDARLFIETITVPEKYQNLIDMIDYVNSDDTTYEQELDDLKEHLTDLAKYGGWHQFENIKTDLYRLID